jgi:hypothetical protein
VGALYGVSCTSASSCVAVGFYNTSNGFVQTLAESYSIPINIGP